MNKRGPAHALSANGGPAEASHIVNMINMINMINVINVINMVDVEDRLRGGLAADLLTDDGAFPINRES